MGKTLEKLTKKDYIAFSDPTDGIVVTQPSKIYGNGTILVHYLYHGYKSTSAILKPEEVLAIGNKRGESEIEGWFGKYDVLQKEKLKKALARD